MHKFILLLTATLCFGMEGIPPEKIEEVGLSITASIFKDNKKDFNDALEKYWYTPDNAADIINQIAGQMLKGQGEVTKTFGVPTSKVTLLGTRKVGRIVTALYLSEHSLLDMPVRWNFVQRDGLYYICGIQYGVNILEDVMKFSKVTEGGFGK